MGAGDGLRGGAAKLPGAGGSTGTRSYAEMSVRASQTVCRDPWFVSIFNLLPTKYNIIKINYQKNYVEQKDL